MDLTLTRIQQMVSVITERVREEDLLMYKRILTVAQLQTQATVKILSGLAQSKKAMEGMQKAADRLNFTSGLDPEEKKPKELPSTESVLRAFGQSESGLVASRG